MDSLTKTRLATQQLRNIATAHLAAHGTLRDARELTEGWFNTAYALELADGQRYVLKIAPADTVRVMRYERGIMRSEVEVMRHVRTKTDIPVPHIAAYDTSRQLLNADFFLMEFLPGQPLTQLRDTLSADVRQHIDMATGHLLRQLNDVHGTAFGYYAFPNCTSWREAFALMLEDVLADGHDMAVELPYAELRALLTEQSAVMDEVQTPCMVHWDLWDGNIFVDASSGQITGLIDFERALWGDPLIEATFINLEADTAVLRGYGQSLLATPVQRRRRVLYNFYLALIMIVECYFRGYSKEHEAAPREMLAKELERMHTLPL